MTMPNERARSLRWAAEVLQEISNDPLVNEGERVRAVELLLDFPTPATVLE